MKPHIPALICLLLAVACGNDNPNPQPGIYQSSAAPYAAGPLESAELEIPADDGPPLDVQIVSPAEPGEYAVVVFVHGFVLQNGFYTDMFTHLASHGFVVVAPQLENSLQDTRTAAQDAATVGETLDWLEANLDERIDATPSFDDVAFAGHSRGAKVLWSLMVDDPRAASALAGIDPVDGQGGPDGDEPRVVDGEFSFDSPVFILGTGLGPSDAFGQPCAPEGDNHVQFYAASQSPAWHVVATNYGHMDMIPEDSGCDLLCRICPSGDDPDKMQSLTRGMLTAFFQASIQGRDARYSVLTDVDSAPAEVTVETK